MYGLTYLSVHAFYYGGWLVAKSYLKTTIKECVVLLCCCYIIMRLQKRTICKHTELATRFNWLRSFFSNTFNFQFNYTRRDYWKQHPNTCTCGTSPLETKGAPTHVHAWLDVLIPKNPVVSSWELEDLQFLPKRAWRSITGKNELCNSGGAECTDHQNDP